MEKKKLKFYYRVVTVICLFFLIAGVCFTIYMMADNKIKNISYFEEATGSMAKTITSLIQSNMETLDGVALTIGQMEVTDLEHLLPVIREINNRNSFFRMGFIDAGGSGDMVDMDGTIHQGLDFSAEHFYQKAMEGMNALSDTVSDPYSEKYINYYGVPVIIRGETVGVLAAADHTDRIRSVLDTAMFSRGGYSNIINSSGRYIIRSEHSPEVTNIRMIGSFSDQELGEIAADLSESGERFFEFEENGNKTWGYYLPLELDDWYLLGIVQENQVNGDYYSILGTVLLIVSAFAIFAFLVYGMSRMQIKNKQQLEDLAYRDPLLGIGNFVKFSLDVKTSLDQSEFRKFAFWYGDIDNFKIFNESFGYEEGDELLKKLAVLIRELSAEKELFCRETSDHFVGIRYYEDRAGLLRWYEELTDRLESSVLVDHKAFRLVWSMGFYCVESPEEKRTVNEMYNRARMAQKSIKQEKKIKYAFYSDGIRKQLLHENEIEAQMQQALDAGYFQVYIQPKVAIQENNRITGGEALVRWVDPEKGIISPGDFIPLFEKNGFIIPLDRYMFRQVCAWLKEYLAAGGRTIRIAVNVSRLGIFQEDFVEYYAGVKKAYQIPDEMLELEFTESLAIEDNELLRERIADLGKEGFICSLDDFGSGYSSLNTLKDLPIQVLKLDILFFERGAADEKARIIVENVIHMAKLLNIRVVAEGVEDTEQVDSLRQWGCDVVQGFVFERPMPAEDFGRLIRRDPNGNWGVGFPHAENENCPGTGTICEKKG